MYVPSHFKEDRIPVLHDAIRQTGFAALITFGPDGLIASHVPMLIDPEPAPFGTLHGHLSRGNPQWRDAAPEVEALAIFTGPDAYISPAWYATKRLTGKVVPTWNYIAIHAYGPVRFFDDVERLQALLSKQTETAETPRPEPWTVNDAPEDYIRAQVKGVVGFSLPITRLEGKWKMSQNRSAEDRAGVVEGLAREGGPAEAAVAEIITERNED